MTVEEFQNKLDHWRDNFYIKYKLLDIDFEMFMLMNGLSKEEFKKLIKKV